MTKRSRQKFKYLENETPGQKVTEVTSRDHEASLISPTAEAEGAWERVKKLEIVMLLDFAHHL